MKPDIWGPSGWLFLHTITLAYPINPSYVDKTNYKMFFNSLSSVLPCELCKKHYAQHLQEYPLTDDILSSKHNLTKWLVNIHNNVNKQNGKKEMSYEQFLNKYYKLYNPINYNFIIYFCIFILIILIYIVC